MDAASWISTGVLAVAGILAWFVKDKVKVMDDRQKKTEEKQIEADKKLAVIENIQDTTTKVLTSMDGKLEKILDTQGKHGTKLARISEKVFGAHDSDNERSGVR